MPNFQRRSQTPIFNFQPSKTELQKSIFQHRGQICQKPSPLRCVLLVDTIVAVGEQTPEPCASTWMDGVCSPPPCRRRPGPLSKFKSQCPQTEPKSLFQISIFSNGAKFQFFQFLVPTSKKQPSTIRYVLRIRVNSTVGAGGQMPGSCASTSMGACPPCRRRPGPEQLTSAEWSPPRLEGGRPSRSTWGPSASPWSAQPPPLPAHRRGARKQKQARDREYGMMVTTS